MLCVGRQKEERFKGWKERRDEERKVTGRRKTGREERRGREKKRRDEERKVTVCGKTEIR